MQTQLNYETINYLATDPDKHLIFSVFHKFSKHNFYIIFSHNTLNICGPIFINPLLILITHKWWFIFSRKHVVGPYVQTKWLPTAWQCRLIQEWVGLNFCRTKFAIIQNEDAM